MDYGRLYKSLIGSPLFNLIVSKFLTSGSPDIVLACYKSLTVAPWSNPTASEYFHDGSPDLVAGLLQVANENTVL